MLIVLNSFAVLCLILIAQNNILVKILTKHRRCWNVVRIGHEDLISTTLLKASGRF